jgi:phage terminase small subunit
MTPKQQKFIKEYLSDFNGTRAAIEAGYSPATAYSIAWENLRKPEIADEIAKHVDSLAVGKWERLKILAEIARNGERDSDRIKATELLAKLAGDFIERIEHSGNVGVVVYVPDNKRD